MTSTPNSSFDIIENRNIGNGKTAHNTISKRKSKRLSKRTPVPLIVSFFFLISLFINLFLGNSTND
jgi:hypothetical protein